MRRSLIAASLVIGAFLSSPATGQGKQDFTLVNKTGYPISQVYVSETKTDDWEEDVMGRELLDVDDSVDIGFESKTPGCKFDLKVIYHDDDSSAIWYGLNLCEISKVTIRYNRKTDETSAKVE